MSLGALKEKGRKKSHPGQKLSIPQKANSILRATQLGLWLSKEMVNRGTSVHLSTSPSSAGTLWKGRWCYLWWERGGEGQGKGLEGEGEGELGSKQG